RAAADLLRPARRRALVRVHPPAASRAWGAAGADRPQRALGLSRALVRAGAVVDLERRAEAAGRTPAARRRARRRGAALVRAAGAAHGREAALPHPGPAPAPATRAPAPS